MKKTYIPPLSIKRIDLMMNVSFCQSNPYTIPGTGGEDMDEPEDLN